MQFPDVTRSQSTLEFPETTRVHSSPLNCDRSDEYAYRIPHPVCKPKYIKVKVPSTQDNTVSWAALLSYTAAATAL